MAFEITYSCLSNVGKTRRLNQDNFFCCGKYLELNEVFEEEHHLCGKITSGKRPLFAVFDGMGGTDEGEVSAYIAAKAAKKVTVRKNGITALSKYCQSVNTEICQYAKEKSIVTGTTSAMLLFDNHDITLCNIGDSKVFHFFDNKAEQISVDHLDVCAYNTKPPLLQNLGIRPEEMLIDPYFAVGICNSGDKYLICTDGLTDMVPLAIIEETVNSNDIHKAAAVLMERALSFGGKDNVTLILIEIGNKRIF